MKRLFFLFTILMLSACGIQVDDLGDNWNKGKIDPEFLGNWVNESAEGKDKGAIATVVNQGGMYKTIMDENKARDSDLGKTLLVGNYRFFMAGQNNTYILFGPVPGTLSRYVIKDDRLYAYGLNTTAMLRLLADKYPQEKNITVKDNCSNTTPKEPDCVYLNITVLGPAELKMLSEIPNTTTYWEGQELLRKIRQPSPLN